MDFKSFPSPLHVGPTKRTFDDELQQSPTAKRAKRVRPNRKDRFKEPKGDKESNGNVNEKDRMSSDNVSGTGTAWKETPIIPPMPSAFERILEAHASKSAENSQKSEPKKKVFKKNDVEKNLKKSESRNREVKKNEAKATKDTENSAEWLSATEAKHQYPFNKGTSEVPAIAGPSKIKISKKKPANEHKELTPVSNFTPTRDYTFKAGGGGSGDGEGGGGSAAAREVREKVNRSMLQSRKTLERCLGSYTVDMERAGTREEVAKYGGLAVQYAGDLFKTLG
ncbi:uncharacterized protein B0H64DRAFT_420151 [Chaetomium fimeti]|uniref:Uncharacterized protein n=1 Tax=Chaetomium fimeti TaxID=1854472 RepID=A0AAE0H8T1_9PEZI|nr:hypothetical protein B0H64DRAFT_420151 [Chaetomium fimeti]